MNSKLFFGLLLGGLLLTAQDSCNDSDPDLDGDGYTTAEGDCNDQHYLIHPGAVDYCSDGADWDCDGNDFATWNVEESFRAEYPELTIEEYSSAAFRVTTYTIAGNATVFTADCATCLNGYENHNLALEALLYVEDVDQANNGTTGYLAVTPLAEYAFEKYAYAGHNFQYTSVYEGEASNDITLYEPVVGKYSYWKNASSPEAWQTKICLGENCIQSPSTNIDPDDYLRLGVILGEGSHTYLLSKEVRYCSTMNQ